MARTKVALPLVVALIFAIAGAVIAYKWAQSQKMVTGAQKVSVSGDIVNVAVAAEQIPWGTKLSVLGKEEKPWLKSLNRIITSISNPCMELR